MAPPPFDGTCTGSSPPAASRPSGSFRCGASSSDRGAWPSRSLPTWNPRPSVSATRARTSGWHGTPGQCLARTRWQKGSCSQNHTVRIPARSNPRSKPPMPLKRLPTFTSARTPRAPIGPSRGKAGGSGAGSPRSPGSPAARPSPTRGGCRTDSRPAPSRLGPALSGCRAAPTSATPGRA